jgi:RimJ/RimL family protein N-acetyltransferase
LSKVGTGEAWQFAEQRFKLMFRQYDECLPNDGTSTFRRLRAAGPEDVNRVFQWSSDPWLISEIPGLKKVDWQDHICWFAEMMEADSHQLSIIEADDGTGMGTVRLDKAGKDRAIITIFLRRPHVGKGFGVAAIQTACNTGFSRWEWLKSIHAYIKKDNQRSIRAFEKSGFSPVPRKGDAIFILKEMALSKSGEWTSAESSDIHSDEYPNSKRFFSVG